MLNACIDWYMRYVPRWRNGRRGGLKIRFPQGSGGSSPFLGTIQRGLPRRACVTEDGVRSWAMTAAT